MISVIKNIISLYIVTPASYFVIPVKAGIQILLLLLLTSCAVNKPPKATYTLGPTHYHSQKSTQSKYTLLVSSPTASPGYDTKKMLYNKKPYEIMPFAKNQWAGPPAKMLQPLLIQAIRDTGYFHAVLAPPLSARRHWLLKTNLLELRQDFTYSPSCIHMSIQVEIIDKPNDKVVNSQVFSTQVNTFKNTPYEGVIAANKATRILLNRIADFCVNTVVYNQEQLELPPPIGVNAS